MKTLTQAQLTELETTFDAMHKKALADVGENDARYIRRVLATVRYTGFLGRACLFLSFFPVFWVIGTLLLAVSKIMENMEVAHNVMHGQYDWMNDPKLKGQTYEWDIAGTSDNWRQSHNVMHHTYTNIKGVDDDVGYGILRLFPEQRWKPHYLLQPIYTVIFALLFQWGIAIQELRLGRLFAGKTPKAEFQQQWQPVKRKMQKQLLKDYVVFPLLAGPMFLSVFAGNFVANGIRNVWTFVVIFCGHFTKNAEIFPKSVLKNETRGHWYYRQVLGSSNLRGGKFFNLMTGNLSHQIEHHLFPDVPAHRYAEMAIEVKATCKRLGIPYNEGSFISQFSQVLWRILRHALPSKPEGSLDGRKAAQLAS